MLYGENRTRSDCTGIACRRSSSADWQAKKRPIAARSMRRKGTPGDPLCLFQSGGSATAISSARADHPDLPMTSRTREQ